MKTIKFLNKIFSSKSTSEPKDDKEVTVAKASEETKVNKETITPKDDKKATVAEISEETVVSKETVEPEDDKKKAALIEVSEIVRGLDKKKAPLIVVKTTPDVMKLFKEATSPVWEDSKEYKEIRDKILSTPITTPENSPVISKAVVNKTITRSNSASVISTLKDKPAITRTKSTPIISKAELKAVPTETKEAEKVEVKEVETPKVAEKREKIEIPEGFISRKQKDKNIVEIGKATEKGTDSVLRRDTAKDGSVIKYVFNSGCEHSIDIEGRSTLFAPNYFDDILLLAFRMDKNGQYIPYAYDVMQFQKGKLVNVIAHSEGVSCIKDFVKEHLGQEKADSLGVGIGEKSPAVILPYEARMARVAAIRVNAQRAISEKEEVKPVSATPFQDRLKAEQGKAPVSRSVV